MSSSSDNSSVGCGASSSLQVLEVILTKRNLEIWYNFDLCVICSGPNKARCKFCGTIFKYHANSTLKNQIEIKYCKALKNQASRGQTSMTTEGNVFACSAEAVRKQMAHFVSDRTHFFCGRDSICFKDHLDAAERIQHMSSLEGEMEYKREVLEDEVESGRLEGMTDEDAAAYYEALINSS
ncbi:hypothetical protein R6Q57_014718, partial [Mikania cordata]